MVREINVQQAIRVVADLKSIIETKFTKSSERKIKNFIFREKIISIHKGYYIRQLPIKYKPLITIVISQYGP